MAELPQPIRHVLDESVDEQRVYRVWRNVGRARAAAWRGQGRTVRARRHVAMGAAGLAAAAALALALWHAGRDGQGPVRTTEGELPAVLETPAGAAMAEVVHLDDDSRLVITPGARLVTEHNSGERFEARLDRGHVELEIEPGGPRRWRIEAGLATVEVLGTRFLVERGDDSVRVEVLRGRVAVQDNVRGGREELSAGESTVVGGESARSPPARLPSDTEPSGEAVEAAPPAAEPEEAAPAQPTGAVERSRQQSPRWRDLARRGRYDDAWEVLGSSGLSRESRGASTEQLLELADVARLSGHPEDAVAPLERLLREHPGDGRAGLAAFTLGVVHMDQRAAPERAAGAFEQALELGLPAPLREDALARLAEARGRAGDFAGARRAAKRYLEHHPDGERAPDVARWLDGQE